jgi:hypothetical protein
MTHEPERMIFQMRIDYRNMHSNMVWESTL